jgi:hypothetical protein
METVIRRTLELVLTDPEATPLDMQRVLKNDNYRRKRFKTALDSGLLSTAAEMWWDEEYDSISSSAKENKARSTLNRLITFLEGSIELMTCHPKGLDFRQLIDDGYILLVNLKGDEIASEIGALGAILFAQLYMASYSLGEIAGDAPPRYYLIIDETHTFITTALETMFSEARKYGLSLVMVDQWIGQLDKGTQNAIVNNRGTTISFRASEKEAPSTALLYEPEVTTDDLVKQRVGQAAIKTLSRGETLPAFQVQTPRPLQRIQDDALRVTWDSLWQQTIKTLDLMPAEEVRRWIRERYRSKAKDAQNNNTPSPQKVDETDIEVVADNENETPDSGDEG